MERAGSEKSRKNTLLRLEVFLLLSPLNGARSVLTYCVRFSVAGSAFPSKNSPLWSVHQSSLGR